MDEKKTTKKKIPKTNFRKGLKAFTLIRRNDETGISGCGRVLDGVEFFDGTVVVKWRSKLSTLTVFSSFEEFETIHLSSHPENESHVIWGDATNLEDRVKQFNELERERLKLVKERNMLAKEAEKLAQEKEQIKQEQEENDS